MCDVNDAFDNFVTVLDDLSCGIEPDWEVQARYVCCADNLLPGPTTEEIFATEYEHMADAVVITVGDVDYVLNCTSRFAEGLKQVLDNRCNTQGLASETGVVMVEVSGDAIDNN